MYSWLHLKAKSSQVSTRFVCCICTSKYYFCYFYEIYPKWQQKYFQWLNTIPETTHCGVGWWRYHVPMMLCEAKDKWRAYVMPHDPIYHPPRPNQPSMLVSLSPRLQWVQTTPMLLPTNSHPPLVYDLCFCLLFFLSSLPLHPKKYINFVCPMQSRQESRTRYFMFFILCISNFTPIKIKVYLKNNYVHYGGAMYSEMATKTTVNEV